MYITQSYKYKYNEIIYVSSNVPKGAIVLEIMDILNAEEGYVLERISDSENVGSSIWLHDGDVQENYIEIESTQPDNLPEGSVDNN